MSRRRAGLGLLVTGSSGLEQLAPAATAMDTTSSRGASATGGANAAGGGTTSGGGATGGSSTTSSTPSTNIGDAMTEMGSPGGGSTTQGPGQPSIAIVRLKDVARIEMGASNYNQSCLFDGKPSVGLAVFQLPGTNALDVAVAVRKKMDELKTRFPEGLDYAIAYDTTPFIRESVADVISALLQAVAFVGVVVLVFLQNWRSVIIPLIAVPIAIISTFAVMAALGFSLNNISLFGLVLAIGIVVDDAIVVVENVERWMERGLPAREATEKAMEEVTGPIIAVALVLCAVFVPCAFVSGITGQFFRQFAVTISVSTIFSTISSLTLSPALAAILIKPHGARRDLFTRLFDFVFGWFFKLFNYVFGRQHDRLCVVGEAADSIPTGDAGSVCGPCRGDVFRVRAGPGRVRAATGPGAIAGEYSAAGLGVAGSNAGSCRGGYGDCSENAGCGPYCWHRGDVVRAANDSSQLRLDVSRVGFVR